MTHSTNARETRAHKNWLAVASAEHVRLGRSSGFMQVCHGKAGPLRRVEPGDRVVYYSPTTSFRGAERLQAFTAIGRVREGLPYPFDMGGGFRPWRRDVDWLPAREMPIRPLLDALDFTSSDRNWGYKLRFGLIEIGEQDMDRIAAAMQACEFALR
jgi:hypothetical protein